MLEHKDSPITYSKAESGYGFTLLPVAPHTDELLHVAFANLQEDTKSYERFVKRWGPVFPTVPNFYKWVEAPSGRAYREDMRYAWRKEQNDAPIVRNALSSAGASMLKITKGRVEIKIDDPFAAAALLFMQDFLTGKTEICGNPECANPYFIKKRATQKFCEAGGCVIYAQRQYALKWWNANGKKWRARRNKQQRRTA